MTKIAVIGAGAVGMATAVNLQQQLHSAQVTVIADKFGTDTTSHGAGGLFRPAPDMVDMPQDIFVRCHRQSYEFFSQVVQTEEACDAGIFRISGYLVYRDTEPVIPTYVKDLVSSIHEVSEKELRSIPGNFKKGFFVQTLIMEPKYYLPWLTKKFLKQGGIFLKHKVTSFQELVGVYDIVVNCCGYGAVQLCNDTKMYPHRGQVARVKAPWLKQFILSYSDYSYYIPNSETVVVGGISQVSEDLQYSKEDEASMWDRVLKFEPSLKNAEVVDRWVGIRPCRNPVRLEKEVISFQDGRKLKVVHNYGHGHSGITLSWGTGMEATKFVQEHLTSSKL